MDKQFDIICFSSEYWDGWALTDPYHLMSIASQTHRVVYVEPGLSILGCLRGWKRLKKPWRRLFPWLHKVHDRLYVLYLPVLPGTHVPVIEKLNHWWVGWGLKCITRLLHFNTPLLWFYHPQFVYLTKTFQQAELICYDCIDEFSEFPSVATVKQKILYTEQCLLRLADLVFTTSPYLYNTRKEKNPATYYLPNAADVEHFRKARLAETQVPDDLQAIPSPVIGFIGAVSVYKLDVALLQYVAEQYPDWHLVFIGPVGAGEEQTNLGQLLTYENVHLLGHREYKTLPEYLKGIDVCMIPYQINEYTRGVFPMKFYEYMATGKPIVTIALPSLAEFDWLVKIAHSPEEFATAIEDLLHHDPNQDERLKAAEGQTWEARAEKIMSLIQERLEEKAHSALSSS